MCESPRHRRQRDRQDEECNQLLPDACHYPPGPVPLGNISAPRTSPVWRSVTKRKKYWLLGILTVILIAIIGAIVTARIAATRFEPMLREQAIRYLRDRFHSQVELTSLRIIPPKMSTLDMLLRKGRGALLSVEGEGLY